MRDYKLTQTGEQVQAAINKILALTNATVETDGLFSKEDKAKLDAIGIHYNTTSYWDGLVGYIPSEGEIIIYSDYSTVTYEGAQPKNVPGVKIGTGNAYVQDLAFIGADIALATLTHIDNSSIHVTAAQKLFWDNKINVDDTAEVVDEVLIFNRN